ncbi:hypothetical protein SOVF_065390 [Spinacia oleracea]|nr:hypothetical protein SOVF_065390 [Spinacia oleracea]
MVVVGSRRRNNKEGEREFVQNREVRGGGLGGSGQWQGRFAVNDRGGGVSTAFASKDILSNVLSGLSMKFSKPFSFGDTIKAGSIEGQVTEMALTTTSLLNAEKFLVTVPNSMFSSQVKSSFLHFFTFVLDFANLH